MIRKGKQNGEKEKEQLQQRKKDKDKEKEAKEEKEENAEEDSLMMQEINEYFENKKIRLLSKGIDNEAIESTMRFKYIRSLEALFESTPQSVLQLVYIMRIGDINIINDPIIIISIFQSILSMTNAMIASDNAYMARAKFKKHKKKLPPSTAYLKHFLIRWCEISYRVGLFALFWTVVGGEWFCVLFAYELMFPFLGNLFAYCEGNDMEWESFFLSLNLVCTV